MAPTALDSLRGDHELIARVLDAAERYAAEIDENPDTDLEDLRAFARFFTDFAQLWHHAKEEEFLIPELIRRGSGWNDLPIARARLDHEQETYLARVLAQLADQDASRLDEPEHRREAIAALRGYVEFQRRHMRNEEATLYPYATEVLAEGALDDIERRSHELETHQFGDSGYAETRRRAESLTSRHPTPTPRPAQARSDALRPIPDLFGRATVILGGHALLRQTVEELRNLCGRLQAEEPVPVEEVQHHIVDLYEQLVPHFQAEEADGYFGTFVTELPGLRPAISRLTAEHREFLRGLDSLRAMIGAVDETELGREIELFVARLTAHERDESALLGRFFAEDAPREMETAEAPPREARPKAC